MVLGILGYVIRFSVFALIENPWLVLPMEVLQGSFLCEVDCQCHTIFNIGKKMSDARVFVPLTELHKNMFAMVM